MPAYAPHHTAAHVSVLLASITHHEEKADNHDDDAEEWTVMDKGGGLMWKTQGDILPSCLTHAVATALFPVPLHHPCRLQPEPSPVTWKQKAVE